MTTRPDNGITANKSYFVPRSSREDYRPRKTLLQVNIFLRAPPGTKSLVISLFILYIIYLVSSNYELRE